VGFVLKAAGNILFLITEQETTGKNAAFHAGITRLFFDQTTMSVFFVRATPAAMSHDISAPVKFYLYLTIIYLTWRYSNG